ncbi:hypothetical protein [Novosphingobium sp. B 225]|uniref:hypothetical protein n=1 Tax=Novosphingobium sp. B 225 TaxID=1961849 RepID=UPI0011250BFC|nr:hypothetical protein [Novosphingobium sp. B 225]
MEVNVNLRSVIGLLMALTMTACGSTTATRTLTVDQVMADIDRLNGKTIKVTGFLGECEALSCRLYRTKAESSDVDQAMSDIHAAIVKGATDVSGFPFPNHPALSIGPGTNWSFFDLQANLLYADSYVVITGRASNHCRSKTVLCFDRASEIEPVSIRSAPPPT